MTNKGNARSRPDVKNINVYLHSEMQNGNSSSHPRVQNTQHNGKSHPRVSSDLMEHSNKNNPHENNLLPSSVTHTNQEK